MDTTIVHFVISLICVLAKTVADDICQPGDLYTLSDDPCKTCVCGDNYLPTERCTTTPCSPPKCPNGTVLTYKPDKCCQYKCIVVDNECIPGLHYYPAGVGCAGCECDSEGFRINCVEYMPGCHVPKCHPWEKQRRPGECCGFYCAKPMARDPTCYRPILRDCPVGRTYMTTWGYNTHTKLCEFYVAGDCKGQMHENSFDSREICEKQCFRSEIWIGLIVGGTIGVLVFTGVIVGLLIYHKFSNKKDQKYLHITQIPKPSKEGEICGNRNSGENVDG